MGVFRFKKFEVVNERSAMKVNTDGVLLGAAMTIKQADRYLLDIGTGTGTIALMAAQRLSQACIGHSDKRSISLRSSEAVRMTDAGPGDCPTEGPDARRIGRSISPCSCDEGLTGRQIERSISLCSCDEGPDARRIGRSISPILCEAEPTGIRTLCLHAIDIDEASATEAEANFRNSPWHDHLHAFNMSLDEFARNGGGTEYDLIFSNPPYFEDSFNAPEERRNNARHTSTGLSYREILDFASEHLSDEGRVSLVLPAETEHALCRHARMYGLHLFRILRIRTVPRKAPSRIIAEFSRKRTETPEDRILTIQNEGKYTEEYLSLMRDFYLFA